MGHLVMFASSYEVQLLLRVRMECGLGYVEVSEEAWDRMQVT